MRVDPRFAAAVASALTAPRRAAAPGAFAPAGTEEAPRATTAGTSQTGMLSGLDTILTLQGQDGAEAQKERRRRSVQRGHDLLDGLDRLKAALIGGRVATRDLQAIAGRLAERMAESGDPRLDGLVAEIELRAAVELAKLEAPIGR
ncbi:flagellar assembly protein fliX [Methylorubrum populi]|uniref:Flagellar assembly protein fliX n=1 Tax=Methylorubrum populi TaxID=223967 RepID=A0A160PIV8_9HYPH|nr:flagellar assembly protein FliX [Methylorubrum populi]BAU91951.1 flagellar assembly protein fliX [Methylorubrum populi]